VSEPAVSVLMAMYNAAAHLRAAVTSVLAQTFTNFEFVIVDDGSTDDSAAIVEGFDDPRIRLIRNAENKGQTACLNQGLVLARGEWIARQDADDLSDPGRLARQMACLQAHPKTVLLGSAGRQIDGDGRALGEVRLPVEPWEIRWLNFFDNSFLHSAVIFRTAVVRDGFGGYDERYRCSQDYALWSQLARQWPVANLPESLIALRVHAASMMRSQTSLLEAETARIQEANLEAEFPSGVFTEADRALIGSYRWRIEPARLRVFHALVKKMRADFVHRHPAAGPAVRRANAQQAAHLAYNLLPAHRTAAAGELLRAVATDPAILTALPWPRLLGLLLLGDHARTLYRRFVPAQ
jgi:Glycosyl transferase family 2